MSASRTPSPRVLPVIRGSRRRSRPDRRRLARYTDEQGCLREIVSRPGAQGSTLVIDRDPLGTGQQWLVAHLGAEEPPENARIVCMAYLHSAPVDRCCRPVAARDWTASPQHHPLASGGWRICEQQPLTAGGWTVRIGLVPSHMAIPTLRWTRLGEGAQPDAAPISLREAIAAEQSYEPFRQLTWAALEAHAADAGVSVTVLRAELDRVLESPIVLNRRLREAVLDHVARRATSMSEIAIRCGRVKQDRRGKVNGETSWLARRIGLLPEARQARPTPWVHSDVLGLIAREGLGISPMEAELR